MIMKDELGQELLIALRKTCGVKKVIELLNQGADINTTDEEKNSVLHYAVENSWGYYFPTINLLIKKGADVLHQNNKGETPLFKAAALNYNVIVKLFLTQNISSVTIKDNSNRKPVDVTLDEELKVLLNMAENIYLNNDGSLKNYYDYVYTQAKFQIIGENNGIADHDLI